MKNSLVNLNPSGWLRTNPNTSDLRDMAAGHASPSGQGATRPTRRPSGGRNQSPSAPRIKTGASKKTRR